MTTKSNFLSSLALGGYRSFGPIQYFDKFSKINLIIGQNNSGKSNLLRFIHDIYPQLSESKPVKLDQLDRHLNSEFKFVAGVKLSMHQNDKSEFEDFNNLVLPKFKEHQRRNSLIGELLAVFKNKAASDNQKDVWFEYGDNRNLKEEPWFNAYKSIGGSNLYNLFHILTGASGGSESEHWIPELINRFNIKPSAIKSELIPAIRKIGIKHTVASDFSGEGIIERLVKLQNPDVHNQNDKRKFENINKFLQIVTNNQTANIEITHERDTIIVHMDGKSLPLEYLGTGIHEVIILAAAATLLDNTVICMEEPELHLNPILQKKLIQYLATSTSNQYFISTHSAALMDTADAEIFHVVMKENYSSIEKVTSDKHRSEICEDLGYHPSDLIQANCIIWVEGPSDRVYINNWIKNKKPNLFEGIHYSIMFYGGKLASHLSAENELDSVNQFISLKRLNRRSMIVIDSDRQKKNARLNSTKIRLIEEFNKGPGHAWVTEGREIENYIDKEEIIKAINETNPSYKITSKFTKYDNNLSIKTKGGKATQASKVNISNYITKNFEPNYKVLDLNKQMDNLVKFVTSSNKTLHI